VTRPKANQLSAFNATAGFVPYVSLPERGRVAGGISSRRKCPCRPFDSPARWVFKGDFGVIMTKVKEFGFGGIMANRLDSRYTPGEAFGAWLKHKLQ
jgi:hypothetical protein